MLEAIKPIETIYNGMRFRSRLEARWALFFDTLKIKWEYENEGYETAMGRYLPDFWLPEVYLRTNYRKGILFEVKPDDYGVTHEILEAVGNSLHVGGILARGFNPNDDIYPDYSGGFIEIAPSWDAPMHLVICKKCQHTRFEFGEYLWDSCVECNYHGYDEEIVSKSADIVRAHRFW